MSIGNKIADARKDNNLTQEQLAELLNVTRQSVSRWEQDVALPEMEKVVRLCKILHISCDYLLQDMENHHESKVEEEPTRHYFGYEYKSRRTIMGMPLIHINVGFGFRKARGIIAIGNIATGLFALGGLAFGLFAIGGMAVGLLAIAGFALGLFAAVGGLACGAVAIGGIACGLLAIGGCAIGLYTIGGVSIAANIAYGGLAQGHIAIGNTTHGVFEYDDHVTKEVLRQIIEQEFPRLWILIKNIFINLGH